jgi:hypothetical protein
MESLMLKLHVTKLFMWLSNKSEQENLMAKYPKQASFCWHENEVPSTFILTHTQKHNLKQPDINLSVIFLLLSFSGPAL